MASRTVSINEEMAQENTLLRLWTQTWGLKVYPAYGIDKLKFSFIEKGKNGQGKSFDIYMSTDRDGAVCFDNWAWDILHGSFTQVMAFEKKNGEKYPKAFKYVTGEKGDRTIGIMNSTNGGYCINATVPAPGGNGKLFANVPVSFHDLRHLAEKYMRSYEPRRCYLEEMRRKTAEDQQQYYQNKAHDDEPVADGTTAGNDGANVAPSQEQPKATTRKIEAVASTAVGKTFCFHTVAGDPTVTEEGTFISVNIEGFKQVGKLLFKSDSNVSWLPQLIQATKTESKKIVALAEQHGAVFTFLQVAKTA